MPTEVQKELLEEDVKRARKQFLVKISKPCPLSMEELREWLAEVLGWVPKVEDQPSTFLVDCGTENNREIVLACNGTEIRGIPLVVNSLRRGFTYPEAAQWLMARLQTQEEVEATVYGNTGDAMVWEVRPKEISESSQPKSGGGPTNVHFSTPTTSNTRPPTPPRPRSSKGKGGRGKGFSNYLNQTSYTTSSNNNNNNGKGQWGKSQGKGASGRGSGSYAGGKMVVARAIGPWHTGSPRILIGTRTVGIVGLTKGRFITTIKLANFTNDCSG